MYHIYNIDVHDSSFDWHVYAKSYDDASQIVNAVMDELLEECKNLAYEINFEEILDDLLSDDYPIPRPYLAERDRINQLFKKFDSSIIKQYETVGGYVLDYALYSGLSRGKLQDEAAIEHMESVCDERNFFFSMGDDYQEIKELRMENGASIAVPDYNAHIEAKIVIDKRDEDSLLNWAKPRLKLSCEPGGLANELGRSLVYTIRLDNVQQFCQLLNYVPFAKIRSISYS